MESEGSVTQWFEELERGNPDATQALWDRFFPDLVRLARQKLRDTPQRMADEEDVALSVMDSFFEAAQQQRFPDLADRLGLWRLLLQMTARKVIDYRRHETRQRRGGGRVHGEGDQADGDILAQIVGTAPTPEIAAMMAEQCSRLLGQLEDSDLRDMAIARMQGATNDEIAAQHRCSVRTVARRLQLIRKIWEEEQPP